MEVSSEGLHLKEVMDGYTEAEVIQATGAPLMNKVRN